MVVKTLLYCDAYLGLELCLSAEHAWDRALLATRHANSSQLSVCMRHSHSAMDRKGGFRPISGHGGTLIIAARVVAARVLCSLDAQDRR